MAITAVFSGSSKTYTEPLYQFDRGQILYVEGIGLPGPYEVHFSNDESHGIAAAANEKLGGFLIPDCYLQTGEYIYAWIYVTDKKDVGKSTYMAVIPVIPRPAILPKQGGDGYLDGYDYMVDDINEVLIITEKEDQQ